MSKQAIVLTLSADQLQAACEQYAGRLFDPAMYQATATVQAGSKVVVSVSKRRAPRKAKAKPQSATA